MASAFVSQEPVPVSLPADPANIVWIRPKMGYGRLQRVQAALAGTVRPGMVPADMALDLGAANVALLAENIVKWEGPLFGGELVTQANIARLDPDLPLLDAVLAAIAARNPQEAPAGAGSADPNASMSAGA